MGKFSSIKKFKFDILKMYFKTQAIIDLTTRFRTRVRVRSYYLPNSVVRPTCVLKKGLTGEEQTLRSKYLYLSLYSSTHGSITV